MAVVFWQLKVISTIVIAHFFSRKIAFYIVIGWTIWTFLVISYTPLMVIQLGSAWGTWSVLSSWKRKDIELEKLRKTIKDYPEQTRVMIEHAGNKGRVKPLIDSEHYSFLLTALQNSRSSFLVLSGWVSDKVIDDVFINELKQAMQRGVIIFLGFGYEDSRGIHKLFSGSKEALHKLFKLSNNSVSLQGNLYIGQFNNHQKILIQDQWKVVCGSHNWLSNKTFRNRETSFIVEDQTLATTLFNEISKQIQSHPAQEKNR